ncbi:hypothetical protein GYH30_050907 [Glycine max]|nr:hypothetical protein GYH30_050907 [Glycine max]
MSITTGICQVVAVSLLLGLLSVYSLECDDDRCKTGLCNNTGACICNLPDPSTILNGDRTFFGGKFCDEEMTMCDGTNSFWCEHGATCEEIVQGEKYSCKCPLGFAGEHCEHSGAPCGHTFCFHNAECLAETGDVCQCPSEWKGSADCSLPTTPTDFLLQIFTQFQLTQNHLKSAAAVTPIRHWLSWQFLQWEELLLVPFMARNYSTRKKERQGSSNYLKCRLKGYWMMMVMRRMKTTIWYPKGSMVIFHTISGHFLFQHQNILALLAQVVFFVSFHNWQ